MRKKSGIVLSKDPVHLLKTKLADPTYLNDEGWLGMLREADRN